MRDQRRRSIVKGITWRLLATADTLLLALIFTGSATAALSIGGLELLTKTVWYYLHERAWVWVGSPHAPARLTSLFGASAHTRSITKAVTWRIVGALDTFLIALLITGRLGVSGSIGGTELLTKIGLYYFHERLWLHIPWGLAPVLLPVREAASRLRDFFETLRRYYHIGAAIFYGFVCILFIIVSASIIYLLHGAL